MTSRVLHAAWAGEPSWHRSGDDGRRRPWVEPAVLQVEVSVGAANLYFYRLSNRLTLLEMVTRLGNCVTAAELRDVELGRTDLPDPLSSWLSL
jgi:hypothetical protein